MKTNLANYNKLLLAACLAKTYLIITNIIGGQEKVENGHPGTRRALPVHCLGDAVPSECKDVGWEICRMSLHTV